MKEATQFSLYLSLAIFALLKKTKRLSKQNKIRAQQKCRNMQFKGMYFCLLKKKGMYFCSLHLNTNRNKTNYANPKCYGGKKNLPSREGERTQLVFVLFYFLK